MSNVTTTKNDMTAEFLACVSLYKSGKIQECLECILELQKSYPDNIDITYITAICYMELGQYKHAEILFEKCAAIIKTSEELFCNMGILYDKTGDIEKAVAAYKNALVVNPNNIAAINNLGNIYNSIGLNQLALDCFNKLVSLGHDHYYVYNNISLVYKKLGMLTEALEAMTKCLSTNPQDFHPYHNAALLFTAMGNKQTAFACYEEAFKFAPQNSQIVSEYRDLCVNACDWKKYEELDNHLAMLVKSGADLGIIAPMSDIQKNINPQSNLSHAIAYTNNQIKNILKTNKPFVHNPATRGTSGKLRLGYLSSDIKDHPVAHLMRGVFQNHNKDEFEIFLYSSSEDNKLDKSGYRDAIKSCCDHFIDIRTTSNLDLANKIYADKIDILVDLNGHTGISRIETLALKPSPVQISYIGYIGSMGADFIDYIITDKIVTPPEHQQFYTEKLLYMPNCYQANDNSLEIAAEETTRYENSLPENSFVFCSFNQTYKIDSIMFKHWMNILKRVPESVLWLFKGSIYLHDNLARDNLFKNAAEHGVDPARLIFADGVPIAHHLKRIGLADLALDTRIYNGGTVTSQTLWAGVPVLTLEGGHFASRMAASILNAVGMQELITKTPEEYEELAVKIATKKGESAKLKRKLAKNKTTYPLFDTKQFTKDMEQLYKTAFYNFTNI